MRYKNAAGAQLEPAGRWPAESTVARVPGRSMLVLAAHPHCPCTRASLTELDRLLVRAGGRLQAVVLFVKPRGAPEGWEDTDLWRRVAAMPAARPLLDVDGVEAHRFRALTSGQTLVYDQEGNLLFSGGITSARGHEGNSVGRGLILAALDGARLEHPTAPVFGCALDSPENGGTP
ncbi:MAG: RedB protein [Deltaproteobacteria bacterium]|nr:MAG: RedB protein [Deltaproteobacteria bacterium]